MGKIKLILGASILLLVSVQAGAIPISYQFHGEVTETFDFSPPLCFTPPCIPAVTVGEKYTGFLLYDVDTLIGLGPPFIGGVPFYSLVFDNFVLFDDEISGGSQNNACDGCPENDTISFVLEDPFGVGISGGADLVAINLRSDTPDAITQDNQFPANLDNFSSGEIGAVSDDLFWKGPYSNSEWYGTIEDFRRVSPLPEAVPAPAAIWLFGIGLIGLIGFTKRRKMT